MGPDTFSAFVLKPKSTRCQTLIETLILAQTQMFRVNRPLVLYNRKFIQQQICIENFQTNDAIRYLEFAIQMLDNRDQAIHNYLLSLYAKLQPDQLMKYLNFQGQVCGFQ